MGKQEQNNINHIGIAVSSLNESLPFYVDHLNLKLEGIEEVPSQGVKVAFLKVGETKIELLEPLSTDSTIAKIIKKRGEGIHHIALGVSNIKERIDHLKASGIQMIHNEPIKGAGEMKAAFLHPKTAGGILYELCEKTKELNK
ncbi:methylmalonyl-CoA epimerase [Alkalihalobacillus sp. BA299]|uniref:methylmalonyl-CoA epimerase n=1 Tax=Alkalihalobacillus sp. BA299 TaxID=2815938 RepID=UPI001AD95885|nr:methylmalonyl-CoA epimerase [Alkalihalobacillus sp. BA299]